MGSHPPGIGKRSGTVFRGGEKDRSPRGGRGIAESWPLEWQGVDARSLEVVSPSLEASRQKRATRVREHAEMPGTPQSSQGRGSSLGVEGK